jgi:actin-like protein 6A
VESGTAPRFAVREDRFSKTTPSLASYYENREVEEWIQSVAGVLDQGWNDQCAFFTTYHLVSETSRFAPSRAASQRPMRHYEFPTGFNTYFGPERFQVGELFFAHSRELVVSSLSFPFLTLRVLLPKLYM